MSGIVIGIDPDSDRSGIAVVDVSTRHIDVAAMRFPALIDEICRRLGMAERDGKSVTVYIEAGWLNASNWHLSRHDSRNVASKKGVGLGMCHQTGRLIAEMCEHHKVDFVLVKPLQKRWSGRDRKITQQELERFTGKIRGRINQEGRDAALLAWVYAGLPLRV